MNAYQIPGAAAILHPARATAPGLAIADGFVVALEGEEEFNAWRQWGTKPLPRELYALARKGLIVRGVRVPPELETP